MHLRLRQQDDRKRTDGKTALIGKRPQEEERRYLQGVTYVLPKDLPEQSRLDFQHYLLYTVLGTHAAAPVGEQVRHILDVATGTGRCVNANSQMTHFAKLNLTLPILPT